MTQLRLQLFPCILHGIDAVLVVDLSHVTTSQKIIGIEISYLHSSDWHATLVGQEPGANLDRLASRIEF